MEEEEEEEEEEEDVVVVVSMSTTLERRDERHSLAVSLTNASTSPRSVTRDSIQSSSYERRTEGLGV